MKPIYFLLTAILISASSFAQLTHPARISAGMKMVGNKMWVITKLTDTTTLGNGTKVTAEGTVILISGKSYNLQAGNSLSFDGRTIFISEKSDEVSLICKRNIVWSYVLMDKSVLLSNGNQLMPKGSIKVHGGKTIKLHNNDTLDMNGNVLVAAR